MTDEKTVGMTLGKFAPLHRGHQHVIETAMAETDHVIVVIYDAPQETRVPLPVRADWISKLYPDVEVILAWDGPTQVSDDPAITKEHDAYLQRTLEGKGVTHFFSSEFYGDHVSRGLGAIDRQVDPDRKSNSISATEIRRDLYQHRDFVDPIVYRDLITKVVFVGAPSTGKTTLAKRMAEIFQTRWMPEFGREYWDAHQVDRQLTQTQLVEIAAEHCHREDELVLSARKYLFVDTDATTTRQFSLDYHGTVHPKLEAYADKCPMRYDLCFLCGTDIPYDNTWDRSGETHREVFQSKIEADLMAKNIAFIRLLGTIEQRASQVERVLNKFKKYDSNAFTRSGSDTVFGG